MMFISLQKMGEEMMAMMAIRSVVLPYQLPGKIEVSSSLQ